MKEIRGIGHMAIRVKDIERSLQFYCGKLGFREMLRLNEDDGRLMLIYLRITDQHYLELFPDAVGDHAPGKEAVGFNHLCLEISDLDAAVARLAELGVPLTTPVKMGLDGNRQAWIDDPDGNRIELMEMSPDCLQFRAIERLKAEAGTDD